jgi:hypothetical protein
MFQNPDGDVEEGELVRDMGAWKKDEEQRRGGWAEGKIKELELQSGADNAGKVDKGKGKAVETKTKRRSRNRQRAGSYTSSVRKKDPRGWRRWSIGHWGSSLMPSR